MKLGTAPMSSAFNPGAINEMSLGFDISHNLTGFVGVGGYLQEKAPQKFNLKDFKLVISFFHVFPVSFMSFDYQPRWAMRPNSTATDRHKSST